MRYHVHGRNPKPHFSKADYERLLIEIDFLRKQNAELKEEVKVMRNTFAITNFDFNTRGAASPTTRAILTHLSEDLMNITFQKCINNNWVNNLPKLDGRIVISTPSHSFNFEDKEAIKLKIVNLHSFPISFSVFYKSHESKQYYKLQLSGDQTLQAVPNNIWENIDGPHTAIYPLSNCCLPENIKVHEVPATDYYLIIVWPCAKNTSLQLVRKVNIYNENQMVLEKIKDEELDKEALRNFNPDQELVGSLNKLSVSEK